MTVLAHDDVETIANKNNLTFTELLQPFSKMLTDVTIKDADGANHNVPALNIVLQDFKKDPHKQVEKQARTLFEFCEIIVFRLKTENNFVGKSEVDAGQSGRGERGREGSDLKTLSQDHC